MAASNVVAEELRAVSRWWWLFLVAGILWIAVGLIILQFDSASAASVGIIVGVMFMVAGAQYLVVGGLAEGWRWLWFLMGALLLVAGFVALVYPTRTFAAIADVLGFLFALGGVIWIVEAFATREINPLWGLGLAAGIVLVLLGVWAGSQMFLTRAYTLLVFAGVWAIFHGILDIFRAFEVRRLGKIAMSI